MRFCRMPVCTKRSLGNWATLCILLVVTFLLYQDPYVVIWWHELPIQMSNADELSLDMAPDSIDDMYIGCRPEAAAMIDQFGVYEWDVNPAFSIAWASAEEKAKKPLHKDMREEHATALYMHTNDKLKEIQQDFNTAAKTGKVNYNTDRFKYHYLYFHLTEAIQVLRQNQPPCRTTYHRTGRRLNQNVVNNEMRFGTFTLTASSKHPFGLSRTASCFEIYTCFGAEITHYSSTQQSGQVLIPPYEVFRITEVLTNGQWCDVVYKLQSTKTPKSDLNCKLDQSKLNTYLRAVSTHCPRPNYAITSVCLILLILSSVVLIQRRQQHFVVTVLGIILVLIVIAVVWKRCELIKKGLLL